MSFKVGDLVEVVKVTPDYTITGEGSYGRVVFFGANVYKMKTVIVDFMFTTKKPSSGLMRWEIREDHLAPMTKLSKLLMGIQDET